MNGRLKIISGTGHPALAKEIAKILEADWVESKVTTFDNGEIYPERKGDVRDSDLFFINSLHSRNPQSTIEETEFLISTCVGSAKRITGVFPFLGYCKADHQTKYGEAVSIKVVARRLSMCGFDYIMSYDLHKSQIVNYFEKHFGLKEIMHFYLMRQLIEYAQKHLQYNSIAGLDEGSYKRNALIARYINCNDISFVYKERDPKTKKINLKKSQVIGNVEKKNVIGFDDMIQSFSTGEVSATVLKEKGAKSVTLLAVHPDFNPKTQANINKALETGIVDKIIVLETIPVQKNGWHKNFIVLSPAKMIAKTIRHLHKGTPMRSLFLPIH